ncbi:MAG: CBS domain-containing protein [Archangiaceae bacterium]|nr:CBS domain-containing protein [Archangiaceae bacterium]
MIRIDAVMTTAVLTVKDTDPVSLAASNMAAAGIRHLPVSDGHNHVVGMLSTHDVAAVGARSKKRVGEVMSREVKTVRPEEPAASAIATMIENKIGSLPVVDADQNLVGIVTETDFLQIAYQALTGGRSREPREDAGSQ